MKRIITILSLMYLSAFLNSVTLSECLSSLRDTTPISDQLVLYENQMHLTNEKLNANYLPSLYLTGNASWNSEITKIEFGSAIPVNPPTPDKDREGLGIELRQMIWDGGITSLSKKANKLNSEANVLESISRVRAREQEAASIFFNIVNFTDTIEILELQRSNLNARLSQTEQLHQNGLKEISDVRLVQLDLLKLDGEIVSLKVKKRTAIRKLSQLTNLNLMSETEFIFPFYFENSSQKVKLFEIERLDALISLQKLSAKMINRKLYPQITAKADYSYGKPGYNMFSTDYHDYYSAGVGLSWKLWDFNQVAKEKRIALNQAEIISATKDDLLLTIDHQLKTIDSEIRSINYLLELSNERVALLTEIVSSFEHKFESGVITTSDLLVQSNNLMSAQIEQRQYRTNLSALEVKKILTLGGKL